MMSTTYLALCLTMLGAFGTPLCAQVAQGTPGNNAASARHLMVDGVRIYYETYGTGRPVVLLHGGLFGSIAEFSGIIPELARNRKVIAIALRGHGKSEMGTEPLTNLRFARDAAAIVRHESRDSVDVIGFSTGAIAAYFLVIEAPALVRSVIAIGGPIAASGSTEAGVAESAVYKTPEKLDSLYPSLVARQKRLYQDPKEWHRLVTSFAAMATESDIADAKVRGIAQPVLIMTGDRDHYTRTDHFVHIAQLLRRGSLAVIPGCGHVVLTCKAELVRLVIMDFLRERN